MVMMSAKLDLHNEMAELFRNVDDDKATESNDDIADLSGN